NLFYLYVKSENRSAAQALFDKVIAPHKDEGAIRWARLGLEAYDSAHRPKDAESTEDIPGKTSAVPPDEALFEQRKRSYIETLEKSLKETTDPESRKRLEEAIAQTRAQVNLPAQIDVFNQAVKQANAQDYVGAMASLEKLLPEVQDSELRTRIEQMLTSLKQRIGPTK